MSNLRDMAIGIGADGSSALKVIRQIGNSMDDLKDSSKSLGKSFEQIGIDAEKSVKHIGNQYKLWNLEASDMDKILQGNKMNTQALGDQIGVLDGAIVQTGLALQKTKKEYGDNSEEAKKLEHQLLELKVQHAELSQELENNSGNKKLGQNLQKVGGIAADVGKKMTIGVTAPIVGLGIKSAQVGMEFESSMSNVQAVTGVTGKQLEQLEKKAREMGAATSKSAKDAADAMGYMGLAGWNNEKILGGIEPILRLSEAGNLDLARASDLVTDSMAALGVQVQDLPRYLDTVAQSSRKSNTNIDMMMEAYLKVGGVFKNLNVPMEEQASLLGILANRGQKGAEAGNALSSTITNLTAPVGQAKNSLAELGLSAFDSQGNFKGLENVLMEFKSKLSGMTEAEKNHHIAMIAGKENIKTVNNLLTGLGEEYGQLKGDILGADGALMDMAKTMQDNNKGSLTELSSALEELGLKIYDELKPSIAKGIEFIQGITDNLNSMNTIARKAIIAFGLIAAATGPVIWVLGTFARSIGDIVKHFDLIKSGVGFLSKGLKSAFGLMFNPWVIGIGIAIAIGILLYKNWDTIKEKAGQLKDWIVGKWTGIKESTSEAWNGIKTTVSDKWNSLKDSIVNLGSSIKNGILKTWDNIKTGTADKWNNIKSIASNSIDSLKKVISTIVSKLPSGVIGGLAKMKDGILNIFEGVKNIFGGQLKIIKNIFLGGMLILLDIVTLDFASLGGHIAQVWENIKEGFAQIWQGIGQVFTGAGQYVKGYLMSLWEGIKSGIQIAWQATTDFLFNTWESIKIGAVEGWNSLKESIANIVTSSAEWIKTTWSSMIEWFSTLPSRLYESGVQMFTSLKDGLESLVPAIISKATEVSTAIVDGVKNLPSSMLEIGKNIIQGLINGITGKLGELREKASEIAEAVKSKIKGALNIHSPSRVMIEYGQFTTEGLAIGIENKKDLAENAALELSNLAIKPLQGDSDVQSNTSYHTSPEPLVSSTGNSGDGMVFSPNVTINLQSGSKEEVEMSTKEIENYFDKWIENYFYKLSLKMP